MTCNAGSRCNATISEICPANSWCIDGISTPCQTDKGSMAGSVSEDNCTCPIGYEGDTQSDPCTACQPGMYKDTHGLGSSTPCPPATYSSIYGSTTCLACPAGKYSTVFGETDTNNCIYYIGTEDIAPCTTPQQNQDFFVLLKARPGQCKHLR